MILSGKELSELVKKQISVCCGSFERRFSRKPCLAVVLVGDTPASQTYVRSKKKACEELGIARMTLANWFQRNNGHSLNEAIDHYRKVKSGEIKHGSGPGS